MNNIYIQIPAYRDSELEPTLLNLFRTAKYPDNIRVCVVWQHAEDEILSDKILSHKSIEIIDVPFLQSEGCNWARVILQRMWKGEKYTLFLDSHHRFVKHWDEKMIQMYENLKKDGINKPLITAYLPHYIPHNDPKGRNKKPLKMYAFKREYGILTHLTSRPLPFWNWLKKPIQAEFISLHFIFTEGKFNTEVKMDSDIYFFGDEVLVSLKSFTAGYDLFHPHIILGWHLYDRETRVTHWTDHDSWMDKNRFSYQKLTNIFTGKDSIGLGNVRTLSDYEEFLGFKLLRYENHA